ncbi:P-loop containing nucleoside triphosphate hydrolase protein [Lenzites betulinus]|nr:P-loop containing nucleoside triphosphate hydrolase protein [Lenzites betulinus]
MISVSTSSTALTAASEPLLPGTEVETSLLGDSSFNKSSQELIQFVTTLRSLGAQVLLDLPRIVVIGNQSAGKSSLVEAISGISVPRDAGTCTRCPMECRLAHVPASAGWTCQISIRWEFDGDGMRLDEVAETPFGALLTDKADVEPMLRRAQAAILSVSAMSSGRDAAVRQFEGMAMEEVRRSADPRTGGARVLAFSRNTICVDLKGPELVDLSFVDLPGIVQNAEAEIVQLVEDLVTSYCQGNCLILVALPMSDDIENQKAARIARHADPSGKRTIGVLTKPDTIPAGSTKRRDMWLDVLEGREHVLTHGYYCTRQPDDDQRLAGVTQAAARTAEAEFFRGTPPWSSSTHPHRFGTQNLVKNISELLTKIIGESLPGLLEEVAKQLTQANALLQALPPAVTTEPSAFVLDLITKFSNDVAELVQGSERQAALVQSTRDSYIKFKYAILGTAPQFIPYEDAQRGGAKSKRAFLAIDEEKDENVKVKVPARHLYLEDVREHIRASVTRELPNNIPYSAKRSLIADFQQTWGVHATTCFERVQTELKSRLTELVKHRFERFSHLKAVITPALFEQVNICGLETIAHLETTLKLERGPPFTQNTHYLAEKRAKQLALYKQARASNSRSNKGDGQSEDDESSGSTSRPSTSSFGGFRLQDMRRPEEAEEERGKEESLRTVLSELVKLGYSVKAEDLGKLNPPDEYEEELEVMAEVRAYFQVTYKRVIDSIPLSIDLHLLYTLAERLQAVLIEKLGLGSAKSDARCAAYIAEDPHVAAQRSELLAKKKKLEAVQRELFNFGL